MLVTLTDFLLARIADDEALAYADHPDYDERWRR